MEPRTPQPTRVSSSEPRKRARKSSYSLDPKRREPREDETSPEEVCPICLEPLYGCKTVATCRHDDDHGHEFHRACLTQFLKSSPHDRCPVCREPCVGLRAELAARHLRAHAYEDAFALLVGGATGVLSTAQKDRAIAVLGTALGFTRGGGRTDDTRFHVVVALVLKSLRTSGALEFLIVVMDALGIGVDERAGPATDGAGTVTPLQWFAERPRPSMLSGRERIRAVRVLLALGADADEAWTQLSYRPTGSARIDLALAVAIDVQQAMRNLRGGGFVNETSIEHISNIAFDRG